MPLGSAQPRQGNGECVLSLDRALEACDCVQLSAEMRQLFGLPIDLNAAAREQLLRIRGIGEVRADSILRSRGAAGFASLDELERLPGIGPKTLQQLRARLFVGRDPACDGGGEKKIGGSQDQ